MWDWEARLQCQSERGQSVERSCSQGMVRPGPEHLKGVTDIMIDVGVFYSSEGNFTRQESLQWSNAPEAIGELPSPHCLRSPS